MVRQARAVEVMDVWSAGGRHGRGPAHGPQVGEHQHSETSGAEASSRHHRLAGRAGPRRSGRHPPRQASERAAAAELVGAPRGRLVDPTTSPRGTHPPSPSPALLPTATVRGQATRRGRSPRRTWPLVLVALGGPLRRRGPARPWPERRGSRAVRPRASRMVPPPARFRPKLQQATVKHIFNIRLVSPREVRERQDVP